MANVVLPDVLCRVCQISNLTIQVEGNTVSQVLLNVCLLWPSLKKHLFHDSGDIKEHFIISVKGEQGKQDQQVTNDDTIELMLATSGGNLADYELNNDEVQRYARHLMLPQVGLEGQDKLKKSRVLIVGTGGLGSPVSLYLTAAGIGQLGLIDFDVVDSSNLQRQVVHSESTVGVTKVESARQRLKGLNSFINIKIYNEQLTKDNVLELVSQYDLVVDGTDNFTTRYLLSDACVQLNKPYIFGSIYRFEGQLSVMNYDGGPCYRCLFPEPPPAELAPSCSAGGVLGVLPGVIGCLQANEAIKVILNIGKPLVGRLLRYDALNLTFNEFTFNKRQHCLACGENADLSGLEPPIAVCNTSTQIYLSENNYIEPEQLKEILNDKHSLQLVDVRELEETKISHLPSIIKIPLADLALKIDSLDKNAEIVVICKSGVRSDKAVQILLENDFHNVKSLKGGMLRWAKEIDQSMVVV
ncbi:molybdopterin-synthase adenylyltransferase MoeB [Spartinivicinus ruber]|uniref:molybdopterin-synthase adenylyltransferase MoeB n=1 Tax=Spartinivicinus ruber TaxID=2683272 RepID=UPI0013D46842|nr:molybdopterin-synthase adenylyltransferase MoeB [Spartinivicinus ruber]